MLETLTAGIESGQFAIDQPLLSLESELGPETWAQVEDGIERLSRLCEHAAHLNVSLLFDAEQSYRQAGVHSFVWHLMGEYNKGDFPVVYDTFQMYLRTKVCIQSVLHMMENMKNKRCNKNSALNVCLFC